ncbi:terminase family protein [Kitasatospora sp. RB6PN24]|uniref:phage terminase large subunit family protein n=1 Tax=Kitasatospora humi TaxID=2893891 RepID=UPI001E323D2C|nr:terminase family protein [Kitasatospora humi]MCC9307695.1 terminase family protein [Kitasatospora humi]
MLDVAKLARLKQLRELLAERDRIEAERLRGVDVFGLLGYQPTERQREFHAATEFDVLYGGAAGGGKTRALLMEGIRACVRHPGLRVGAFRRTYPELKESLLAELAQAGYAQALGAVWNASEYELRFPNGSLLMFRYAESLKDATRRQGGQYQLILFDERTLTAPEVCAFLESRLRSGRSDLPVLGIRSGTNPGGPGHGTVKARYIDSTAYGTKVITDRRGREVRFIPSKLADNPHVNAEYADDLRNLPEQLRKAFLDGDWDSFMGQAFGEWNHDRHTLDPITLPAEWRRVMGLDWGFAAPWCALWLAEDEDGRVWVYRELYKTRVGEADQARQILAAEAGETVGPRWADDAMWATRGDAQPIAAVYARNGVHLTEAGKGGRVAGWQRLRSYLADGPACPHHRAQGLEVCPRLHVFRTCENLIREIPALPFATSGDPEDVDSTASDHAADALRYALINLGSGARFHFGEPPAPTPALDPTATGRHDNLRPTVPNVGGFPILQGGDPWAL